MLYPPPFMDLKTLAAHICSAERTIEYWVAQGKFPPPVMQGGRRLWKWKDVERHLGKVNEGVPASGVDNLMEITNATRRASQRA